MPDYKKQDSELLRARWKLEDDRRYVDAEIVETIRKVEIEKKERTGLLNVFHVMGAAHDDIEIYVNELEKLRLRCKVRQEEWPEHPMYKLLGTWQERLATLNFPDRTPYHKLKCDLLTARGLTPRHGGVSFVKLKESIM